MAHASSGSTSSFSELLSGPPYCVSSNFLLAIFFGDRNCCYYVCGCRCRHLEHGALPWFPTKSAVKVIAQVPNRKNHLKIKSVDVVYNGTNQKSKQTSANGGGQGA
jgi:hypothetical protein